VKTRTTAMPLTEKEKAVLRALDSAVVVNFRAQPFEEAIKQISELIKQPILLDRQALEEAPVKYETPVSLETPPTGLAARTVLRRILGDLGLAYVIKEQAIEVTSALKAKNLMVVRSYPIGDVLPNYGPVTALGRPWWMDANAWQLAWATNPTN